MKCVEVKFLLSAASTLRGHYWGAEGAEEAEGGDTFEISTFSKSASFPCIP